MKNVVLLFCVTAIVVSCVKPVTTNPVPKIEYKYATFFGVSPTGYDTAVVVVGYEDGDGDLFRDDIAADYNLFLTPYYYNSDSGYFIKNRKTPISYRIQQPDNGYYKGKSVKGNIYIPLNEIRANKQQKIIKFSIIMQDSKGNVSNAVNSPAYTLDF